MPPKAIFSFVILAGCSFPKVQEDPQEPYYDLCCTPNQGLAAPDLTEYLGAYGIVCLAAGGDFGGTDWVIQGSPETRFRARELVREKVLAGGWKVTWPADHIVLMNEWDQIGFEKGPWIRLASVVHRVTPTPTLVRRLHEAGIQSLFLFGETVDFVFVKTADASASTASLQKVPDAGVQIHHAYTCEHVPPPLIRKGTPTVLSLWIPAVGTGRPLRERVTDPTCSYRVPGARHIVGYSMSLEERPDGTLVATYELPPIPSDVQGSVEYSFTFDLDARRFWHGSPSEPFRVPLR